VVCATPDFPDLRMRAGLHATCTVSSLHCYDHVPSRKSGHQDNMKSILSHQLFAAVLLPIACLQGLLHRDSTWKQDSNPGKAQCKGQSAVTTLLQLQTQKFGASRESMHPICDAQQVHCQTGMSPLPSGWGLQRRGEKCRGGRIWGHGGVHAQA
jgi:hypothetical protein